MCRYAFMKYKPHLACFECRKTFRRRLLGDIKEDDKAESIPAKCPECGNLLADMGLDFKSPTKDDIKAWKHISELYEAGITFHSCGCSGPGYIPRDRATLLIYLEETHQHYVKNLREWLTFYEPRTKQERELMKQKGQIPYAPYQVTKGKQNASKEQVIAYWTERIETIEQRINNIK